MKRKSAKTEIKPAHLRPCSSGEHDFTELSNRSFVWKSSSLAAPKERHGHRIFCRKCACVVTIDE